MALTGDLGNPVEREAAFGESKLKKLEITHGVRKMETNDCIDTCMAETCQEKPTHHATLNLGGLDFDVLFCSKHAERFDIRHGLREYGDVRLVDDYWNREQNRFVISCRDDGVQFYFHCKWCGKDHHHGREEGSRAAHCVDPCPYGTAGYFLVKDPDTP